MKPLEVIYIILALFVIVLANVGLFALWVFGVLILPLWVLNVCLDIPMWICIWVPIGMAAVSALATIQGILEK